MKGEVQVKGDRGSGRGAEVDGDGVGSEEGGAMRPCLPSLATASLAQFGSRGLLDCLCAITACRAMMSSIRCDFCDGLESLLGIDDILRSAFWRCC